MCKLESIFPKSAIQTKTIKSERKTLFLISSKILTKNLIPRKLWLGRGPSEDFTYINKNFNKNGSLRNKKSSKKPDTKKKKSRGVRFQFVLVFFMCIYNTTRRFQGSRSLD